MQLSPRYAGPPVIELDGDGRAAVAVAFARQRRRLLTTLEGLSDEAWAAPSRCEGWRVQDVAAHLAGVDRFWLLSITAGVAGDPTRFLAGFDPKGTPAAMVDVVRAAPPAETLAELRAATEALLDGVEALDEGGWAAVAEAPPGHLPIPLVVHHALWDAWIHERDVCTPLGLSVAEEADEVLACARYAAALGPAFQLVTGAATTPTVGFEVDGPAASFTVEVGDRVVVATGPSAAGVPVVRGPAASVVDALTARAATGVTVPDGARHAVAALATVFESEPAQA